MASPAPTRFNGPVTLNTSLGTTDGLALTITPGPIGRPGVDFAVSPAITAVTNPFFKVVEVTLNGTTPVDIDATGMATTGAYLLMFCSVPVLPSVVHVSGHAILTKATTASAPSVSISQSFSPITDDLNFDWPAPGAPPTGTPRVFARTDAALVDKLHICYFAAPL